MSKKAKSYKQKSIFTNISKLVFFNKKLSLVVFGAILLFGTLSYTNFMRREGFPSVQIPVSVGGGQYFVDDAGVVDKRVAQPLGELVGSLDGVDSVQTVAEANTFQVFAELDSSITNEEGNQLIVDAVRDQGILPEGAKLEMFEIDAAKFLGEHHALVSVFSDGDDSIDEVITKADDLVKMLVKDDLVSVAEILDPYTVNPADEDDKFQSTFSRAFDPADQTFKRSVTVGVSGSSDEDFDLFELEKAVNVVLGEYSNKEGFSATTTADITSDVRQQIDSLQSNVLMGAIVVAIISALMISFRVSALTSVFIVAVLVTTIGIMYLLGFTLNVITLFSLVLALGLFVDDATIIAESIYAKKDPKKKPVEVVKEAINSIGTASFAGTLTTILVFSPLLFITGILGDFIFQMPMTVIISLLTSFFLSITLIPLLANYTILGDKNGTRKPNVIGMFLAGMIEKLRTQPKVGVPWGIGMVIVSFAMIQGGIYLFGTLNSDIFPSGKDGNNLTVTIDFPDDTNIVEAEKISEKIEVKVNKVLEGNIQQAMFGLLNNDDAGLSSEDGAGIEILLTPYQDREPTSVELVDAIRSEFADFKLAEIDAIAANGGPPEVEFPFLTQINVRGDIDQSIGAAQEITDFINGKTVELNNGDEVNVIETEVGFVDNIVRVDGTQQIEVRAKFNVDGTTEITDKFREVVEEEFTDARMSAFSLDSDDIDFDLGQDSDFEESFNALPAAALSAMVVMVVLLMVQFRGVVRSSDNIAKQAAWSVASILGAFPKVLLILVALPFSFFGVAFGLSITDNPLSFFAMIGIIGLIGIAVNNTILLVDNATHHQKEGMGPVGAIAQAMRERFRPLVTTTLTTIAALIPLALSDPFWESLSVTIIFGLASSTLLVVLAFPYYYLFFPSLGRGLKALYGKVKGAK